MRYCVGMCSTVCNLLPSTRNQPDLPQPPQHQPCVCVRVCDSRRPGRALFNVAVSNRVSSHMQTDSRGREEQSFLDEEVCAKDPERETEGHRDESHVKK